LAWLINCVVKIFSALGLFTPERHRIYKKLSSIEEKPLSPRSSMLDFGFFRKAPAEESLDTDLDSRSNPSAGS